MRKLPCTKPLIGSIALLLFCGLQPGIWPDGGPLPGVLMLRRKI